MAKASPILAARIAEVERHEGGLPGAEPIHDMRVAVRRLRAALRLLGLHEMDAPVKELQDALGGVRDLQVQIAWLRRRDPAAAARRRKLLAKATGRLEAALSRWRARTLPRLLSANGSVHLSGARVRRILRKRLKRFEERLEAALARLSPSAAHQVRISVKQLRYLFELTKKTLPDPSQRLLAELRPLQTALGELHDVDVRIRLFPKWRRDQKEARDRLAKVVKADLKRWREEKVVSWARNRLR